MIKLNGWQRIGVILSVLWVLGVACYMWNDLINEAGSIASIELRTCFLKQNVATQNADNCSNVWINAFQHSKEESLKGWWVNFSLLVFIPPTIIFLIWLFSYGIIRLFYWIGAGFAGTKKPASGLKKSFLLTGGIIGLIASIVIFSNVRDANRKSAISKAFAECRMDIIKSNIGTFGDYKYDTYLENCMKTKGYSDDSPQCIGQNYAPDNESCYIRH